MALTTKFSAGFEGNNFSEWTSGGGGALTVSTTQAHSGTYSAYWHLTSNGDVGCAKTGIASGNDPTFSCWIYHDCAANTGGTIYLRNAAFDEGTRIEWSYASAYHKVLAKAYKDDGSSVSTSSYNIQAGATPAWHKITLVYKTAAVGANDGTLELLIDDVSKQTLTGLDNDERGNIGGVNPDFYNNGTNIYMDDFLVTIGTATTNYSLSVVAGSFTISGTAAALTGKPVLAVDSGSFEVTGTAASIWSVLLANQDQQGLGWEIGAYTFPNPALVVEAGAYAVTGTAAGLRVDRKFIPATDAFAVAGTAAVNWATRALAAATVTVAVVGAAAVGAAARTVAADTDSFAVTGTASALKTMRIVLVATDSFGVSGTVVTSTAGRRIHAETAGGCALTLA